MNTDLVIPICPACGSDRTSETHNGQIYCVECNRIYHAIESDTEAAAPAPAEEIAPKAA